MKPVLLVENLFSEVQNPDHVVTGSQEATNHEVWRVASGHRSAFDSWATTSANTDAWVKVDCGAAVAADMVVLDRGHNLAGVAVKVQGSTDGSAWTDVATATIPSDTTDDADLDQANGVVTEEGAWMLRFTSAEYRYWRFFVGAVASFTPEVVGLWLGTAWNPNEHTRRPADEESRSSSWTESRSEYGWAGTGKVVAPYEGELRIYLPDYDAYDAARAFRREYEIRRPAWIVPDPDANAERAFLATLPQGARVAMSFDSGWAYRQASIPYVEHEPLPR